MQLLKKLLEAHRDDLADGYPARAVLAASKFSEPFVKLNELLAPYQISVEKFLDFNDSQVTVKNPHLLKNGLISGVFLPDQTIKIMVTDALFDPTVSTIVIKALSFQSLVVHHLLHRERGHVPCYVFYRRLDESMNSEQELEAMAFGLAHDISCKNLVRVTGDEALHHLSPRLANILDNSIKFEPGSITKLHQYIKAFL